MRSFLAMLGIIIGVGSVISMMSIGAGAKKDILSKISSMGTNLLSIRSNQRRSGGVMSGSFQNLKLDDAKAILEKVSNVDQVDPQVSGNAQLKYLNKNTKSQINGAAVTYTSIGNYEVEFGRFFKETEVNRMARVIVLGSETAADLGITKAQLGESLKLNGINFRVLGILKSKGGSGMFNADELAVVPYTTAMNVLFGQDYLGSIDVMAKDGADLNKVEAEITQLLRKRHKLADADENDFRVFNQAELIQTASSMTQTFTILLGGIAAISLLVGGIGIMNIMLVTVTERTREIGVRKAIGAKDGDILKQFLIESLIMSCLGGIIGVMVGFGISTLIGSVSDFKTSVEVSSVAVSLIFSMAVGVFFGYYPAYRAAMLDPIECLRYE